MKTTLSETNEIQIKIQKLKKKDKEKDETSPFNNKIKINQNPTLEEQQRER